ncbi:GMC family oxidoreductase N-terminal domain-containing protein, partial [Candidatus Pelagibacter sp.]|nr:GMC family oxidoreductase N-terminal domain-containing protein [Candidatus Pelagibacter sp.]
SGAGGATASKLLTENGKDVLLIEEGQNFKVNHFRGSMSKSLLHVWRNSGITPILSKSSFGFGEGRCLGGGTYINGGLIWRTPNKILELWNRIFETSEFSSSNLEKYFSKIEETLELDKYSVEKYHQNRDSIKLDEIAKKYKIKVATVPKSINSTADENKLQLGSPALTKNSVLQKYIYPSLKKGLRLFTNCKANKLISSKKKIEYVEVLYNGNKANIYSNNIILACGATQTPMILKRSFGNKFLKSEMNVHLNLRVGIKFEEEMFADSGIMFSRQIQEYIDDGVLIMPTSFSKSSFFSSLAKMDNLELFKISNELKFYSNFILQIQSKNHVNINNFNNNMLLSYKLNLDDLKKIRKYLIIFLKFMFDLGAVEIFLPLKKNFKINKNINWIRHIEENVIEKNIEMVSVHGMSSAKMGRYRLNNQLFDLNGRSFDFKNLYCVDSSVLPTSTIESPQETIMAIASKIINNIS